MMRDVIVLSLCLSSALVSPATAQAGDVCVDMNRIVTRHTDMTGLTVDLAGGSRTRVAVQGSCQHLADVDRSYVLVFDQRDGERVCRGDRFQIVDPLVVRSGGTAGYGYCRVASITPSK